MAHEKMVASDMRIVKDLVFRTVDAVLQNPRCRRMNGGTDQGVPIIVAIEGYQGDTMYIGPLFIEACAKRTEVCLLSEIRNKDIGVLKDETITRMLIAATQAALCANIVCIADDCVSISSSFARPPLNMSKQREDLARQFVAFRSDPRTGRVSGKGPGGQQDDIIITFMMNLYWSQYFNMSERADYVMFKRRWKTRLWTACAPEAISARISVPFQKDAFVQKQKSDWRG